MQPEIVHVSSVPSDGIRRAARGLRRIAVPTLALMGVAALATSTVSYDWVSAHANSFAVEGDAGITPHEFDLIVLRLRLAAAALIAAAAGLVIARRTIDDLTARVLDSWWVALRVARDGALDLARAQARPYLAMCVVVSITAVALRVSFLDVTIRYDEATTFVNFVSDPLYVALADYSTPNNHPLHTALAKLSVTVFGDDEWALRLPALVAGLALVGAAFGFGWVLYGRAAALVAASFTAVSSTLVEYSTNARGYTLVALFTMTGLLAASRILSGAGAGAWAALAVSGALGAFSVPVMLYSFGGILAWLAASWLVAGRDPGLLARRLASCLAATGVVTAMLYAPMLVASGPSSLASNEFVDSRSWSALVDGLPGALADTARTWIRDLPGVIGGLLGVVLLVSLVLTPRLSRFPVPPLAAFAAAALPIVIAQRVVPYTRVWLFALPVAIVTMSGVLGSLLDRARRFRAPELAAALILAVGTTLVLEEDTVRTSRETGALLDAEAVAGTLAGMLRPGDTVLATGSDTILQYYLERLGVDGGPLYETQHGARVYVVVNTLGNQTIGDLLDASGLDSAPEPALVRSWPSAELYLVRSNG